MLPYTDEVAAKLRNERNAKIEAEIAEIRKQPNIECFGHIWTPQDTIDLKRLHKDDPQDHGLIQSVNAAHAAAKAKRSAIESLRIAAEKEAGRNHRAAQRCADYWARVESTRKAKKLTWKVLSEKCGFDVRKATNRLNEVEDIAAALGVDPCWLAFGPAKAAEQPTTPSPAQPTEQPDPKVLA